MSVLYRLMQFDDLRAYVQGVAAHPILGPQRRLLTYLRDYPKELRPVSRRLLRLPAA